MTLERRLGAGMLEQPSDDPGLVLDADGVVWLVAADGTRTQLQAGGGSSPVKQQTTVVTAEEFRGSLAAGIVIADAPGVGKSIIDAKALFIADAGFTPLATLGGWGIKLGADFNDPVFYLNTLGTADGLGSFLTGGAAGDVLLLDIGAGFNYWGSNSDQQFLGYNAGALDPDNAALFLAAVHGAPTGGAGSFTVVTSYTAIDLP